MNDIFHVEIMYTLPGMSEYFSHKQQKYKYLHKALFITDRIETYCGVSIFLYLLVFYLYLILHTLIKILPNIIRSQNIM